MHPTFKARDYQIDDLARIINNPRTGLGHDPGCGKTYISAMATEYITRCTNDAVVWTQPGGIMEKNKRDILFSTNFDPSQVAIVQGTKAQREEIYKLEEVKVFLMSGQGYSNEWELLPARVKHAVHDEMHLYYAKDSAKRTQEFYRASKKKGAIIPMTGTIIKGRLDSAYPYLHVMCPWAYGNERFFTQNHAWFDENGKVIGWKNHERLKAVLQKSMIFRSFKSIYGDENKVIQVVHLEVSDKVRKLYNSLEKSALIELTDEFVDAGNPAVAAIRARQLLAAPELFEIEEETQKDAVTQIFIEDHLKSGERLAIFSASTQEQLRLVELIRALGGRVGHMNGTVSNAKRAEIDSQFNSGDLQFVVVSPDVAGIGFNWGFLQTMVFASINYTDDSFIQAFRRGIRGKRETPLRVVVLKYDDTIDDRIFEIVDRKSRDHNLINPGIDVLNLSKL